ncbi:hypothetical protein C8D87_105270 [Lentzea atacamensis]|uniref:Uncharacterized protein n=2 Tax=Lentzea atacamensis TaxID=531938 RepID=A0ABX9E7M3_9PSEU|nr:hypothetical protein C8D87_105270 [Lentzea atacamensis]
MLGSPVLDPLGGHTGVLRVARPLARLSAVGLPGLLAEDCLTGTCFDQNIAALAERLQVPAIAIYSREDAIAPWRSCLDPCAECVEVRSTHTGMDLYRVLKRRLAHWADDSRQSTMKRARQRTHEART